MDRDLAGKIWRRFRTRFNIAELPVIWRQFLAHMYDAQIDRNVTRAARKLLRFLHHAAADSGALHILLDRKHAEIDTLAARLKVDATQQPRPIVEQQKYSFAQQFPHLCGIRAVRGFEPTFRQKRPIHQCSNALRIRWASLAKCSIRRHQLSLAKYAFIRFKPSSMSACDTA